MKCPICKREVEDLSIFCNWCGKRLVKDKRKSIAVNVPEPRQLPSGAWNIQLRKEGESITESTAERCRRAALEVRRKWLAEEKLGLHKSPDAVVSLGDAIDSYIANNCNILSVSTQRAYKSYRKHRMQSCMDWNVFDETNPWQAAINSELEDVSAKTVANVWRLCTVAIRSAGAPVPDVRLRRFVLKESQFLRYDQIDKFLDAIKGQDCELGALLALNSLRHSEIIALKPSDISIEDQKLIVRGSRVLNSEGKYVYSELNKTKKSRREIPIIIPRLLELLKEVDPEDEYVFDWSEKRLYDHIKRICKKNDLPPIGVHALRHSFASLAYHIGWKEKSTEAVGGWSNSNTVRNIYTHNADLDADIKAMKEFYES